MSLGGGVKCDGAQAQCSEWLLSAASEENKKDIMDTNQRLKRVLFTLSKQNYSQVFSIWRLEVVIRDRP